MNRKITETIEKLQMLKRNGFPGQEKTLDDAIHSLEAWGKVLDDLNHAQEITPMRYGFSGGVQTSREIIEKHLGEVEE